MSANREEKSVSHEIIKQKAIRTSYIFPIAFALFLIAIDAYGIFRGLNCHANTYILNGNKFDIATCVLDLIFSYVPSSLSSMMLFVIIQQKFFAIDAGLAKDYLLLTYLFSIVYMIVYAIMIFSVQSNSERVILLVLTIAYCFYIWQKGLNADITKGQRSGEEKTPDATAFSGRLP